MVDGAREMEFNKLTNFLFKKNRAIIDLVKKIYNTWSNPNFVSDQSAHMVKRRLRFFLFSRECVQLSPDAKMFAQTTVTVICPYSFLRLFILCRRPWLTLDVNRSTQLDLPLSSLSLFRSRRSRVSGANARLKCQL